jgi:transposase InsO family protein
VQRGKPVFTAITDPDADRPAGLVNRQFRASAPNRLWDADITGVRTSWILLHRVLRRWPPLS